MYIHVYVYMYIYIYIYIERERDRDGDTPGVPPWQPGRRTTPPPRVGDARFLDVSTT